MIQSFLVTGRFREAENVRHGRIHITGPYRMADCFMLIHHGFMILHPSVAQPQTRMPELPFLFRVQFVRRLLRQNLRLGIERLSFGAMSISTLI